MRRGKMQQVGPSDMREVEARSRKQRKEEEREEKFGKVRDDLYNMYCRIRRFREEDYSPGKEKREEDRARFLDLAEMLDERDIDPTDFLSFVANACDKLFPSTITSEGTVEAYEEGEIRHHTNHFARLDSLEDSAKVMDPEFVLRRGIRQGISPLPLHIFALSHGFDVEEPDLSEDAATEWLLASKKQRELIKRTHPEAAERVDEMARKGA